MAGLSDPACALPQRQPPRPPPAPSQSAPEPSLGLQSSVPGLREQCQLPVNLGVFQAPIPAPSHSPPPPGPCGPGFKAASHLDFIFTASQSPAFYYRSGKGFQGPMPGISHYREGKDVYLGALRLFSPTGCHFQTTPHSIHLALNFLLPAEVVCWNHRGEKVICQDNRIHASSFFVCLF